jgi:hypothetical protein
MPSRSCLPRAGDRRALGGRRRAAHRRTAWERLCRISAGPAPRGCDGSRSTTSDSRRWPGRRTWPGRPPAPWPRVRGPTRSRPGVISATWRSRSPRASARPRSAYDGWMTTRSRGRRSRCGSRPNPEAAAPRERSPISTRSRSTAVSTFAAWRSRPAIACTSSARTAPERPPCCASWPATSHPIKATYDGRPGSVGSPNKPSSPSPTKNCSRPTHKAFPVRRTNRGALLGLGLFRHHDLHTAVGKLSTGQLRRLDLARLLHRPVDLMLLDEPTNHLSPALVEDLESALSAYRGALIVVSHDRMLARRFQGRTLGTARRAAGDVDLLTFDR